MKKICIFCCALVTLCLSFHGCSKKHVLLPKKVGTLSLLNLTQEECASLSQKREISEILFTSEGYGEKAIEQEKWEYFLAHSQDFENQRTAVSFFDNLNSMLMALEAREISEMEVPQSVGEYLCAKNSNLVLTIEFDKSAPLNSFSQSLLNLTQSADFSFMLLQGKESLRDKLNKALRDMKNDGTLLQLEKTYINDAIEGADIQPATIKKIPNAEEIRVAVTGDLPPLDYVSSDGTPAGFNTAVLSEISRRLGMNIVLVHVDAGARATALASGTVDVVFWTRANAEATRLANTLVDSGTNALKAEISAEEFSMLKKVDSAQNWTSYDAIDIPDETIITEPYYHDYMTVVITTAELQRTIQVLREKMKNE